jgi:hypothetical protein
MEKKIKDTIEKLLHLAYNYRKGNMSPVNLLKASGYLEFSDQIGEAEIEEILKLYPHLISEWLLWSENKRSTPAWFFTKDDNDGWCFVGHSPESKEFEEINTKDEIKACAAFIKREAESTIFFV